MALPTMVANRLKTGRIVRTAELETLTDRCKTPAPDKMMTGHWGVFITQLARCAPLYNAVGELTATTADFLHTN
jgi:hypothetical protein